MHSDLGVIDVSTLGKLIVEGPDAAAFLERLYPNRFADLAAGRVRYTVLGSDAGRITDDGTVARLAPDLFYVTTTSTGADAVHEWFEWWNAVWRLDVDVVNVTGALAAMNLAGPRAREALASLTSADVSNDALALPRRTRARGRRRHLPGAAHRLRRRARLRAPLREPGGRAALGRARRRGRAAVRPGAAARPAPREAARDRRPGHRFRVEPRRRRAGLAAEAREGRFRRQVGARACRVCASDWSASSPTRCPSRERRSYATAAPSAASRARAAANCSARSSASPGCRPSSPSRTRSSTLQVDGEPRPARVRLRPFHDPAGERVRA